MFKLRLYSAVYCLSIFFKDSQFTVQNHTLPLWQHEVYFMEVNELTLI